MRTLGLDIGEKRIGVALSDPQGILASPLTVLTRKEEQADLESILDLARQHEVNSIVVGLPRSMDGSIGKQAEKVQAFIDKLSEYTEVPVESWDERLSTVAAERMMAEGGMKKTRRVAQRDAVAAALILQGYLDRVQAPSS